MKQQIIFTNEVGPEIDRLAAEYGGTGCVTVTDEVVADAVLPRLSATSTVVAASPRIVIKSGDANKDISGLTAVWRGLADLAATRHTTVLNIGGGVVSDLGGFAAATFKRGLRCINVPTTLLAAADASVGGKTGINFHGVKNLAGTFTEPAATIISDIFFDTLPAQELLSGYAEMLKHSLLEDEASFAALLAGNPAGRGPQALLPLIRQNVQTKKRICDSDLHEQGIRKALNLGHTAGHAFEALALSRRRPVPHGYAVAWGMVTELVLSHMLLGFPSEHVHALAAYVREAYGPQDINCRDYTALTALMRQDKKNLDAGHINFTLLESIGHPRTDCTAGPEEIATALDIYRDLTGC